MTRLRGLYAITPEHPVPDLAQQVALAIAGGARVIQYRDKSADRERRLAEAGALRVLCRAAGVLLIVNDDPALAAAIGADGVHLGRDDGDPAEARRLLGPRAIIGVSCYNRLDLGVAAQATGADYIAFGSFFPSATKPGTISAEPELLLRARAALRLPLVAIGGITPQNGTALIASGADMLAVVSGVFAGPDPKAAAAAYTRLFGIQTEAPNQTGSAP
jgi:thiamine-phosphate pyrophosphorylase